MRRIGTFIRIIIVILPIVLAMPGTGRSASPKTPILEENRRPCVLILHSYYPTFTWTDHITQGIRNAFLESEYSNAALYFEHMDAKRHPDPAYLDQYARLLSAKFPDPDDVDLILCSDDQALDFLLKRAYTLFPNTPVVFCGVNGYRPEMRRQRHRLTGVIEAIDPRRTLEVALALQPGIREVLVITDITRTGQAIERAARTAFVPFEDRLSFRYVSDLSMEALQEEVAALPEHAIVFLFVFNRDNQGHNFTHEESLRLIDSRCRVPIYGPWTFYLGHGIVGGMLTSGEMQGRTAAQLAFRILTGEPAEDIPIVTKSPNHYLFDHSELARYGLPEDKLPPGSSVIHRDSGFYEKYRYRIWAAVVALIVQTTIIVLLLLNMRRRRVAEKELSASEQRYRTLIETIRDLVFIIDKKGTLEYLNPEFETITGYAPIEFIGRPFTEILAPQDIQSTIERFQRGLTGEEIPVYEVEVKHKDRGTVPIELKVTSMLNADGEAVGRIGVARDIRERKEVEEEKMRLQNQLQRAQKMEAIGTLAGGVAHDLNNILSGIVSYPDLLLIQLPENSPLRKPIQTIQTSGHKAAAIVQDLLTLARRGVTASEVVNLNRVVSEYLESPEFEALRSFHPNVAVEAHLEENLLNIMASPIHLSKSLMNLVSNAAEAMPSGGTIHITTENRYVDQPLSGYDHVEEGDYVVLRVSDSGVGIPLEDRERIFEPFYTKKVMGRSGTGLGMAVVWGTLKDLNGYIDVESSEGKGTTFILYFPVTRNPLAADQESPPTMSYQGKGEEILVVDDVETQRDIASMFLSQLEYKVHTVSSGEEAVLFVREHRVDLIMLDMVMEPGMDGLDTYKQILALYPGQKAVIASGFSETNRVKEAQRLGAGPYLRKPYTFEKLGRVIRQELDRGTPPTS
jgi:PAS domain S-box-containing protein